MANVSISLLGAFEVTLEDRPITGFATDKVRALLAYLAVEGARPLRRETLATLLWPEGTDEGARNSLRQAIFQLRRSLADNRGASPLLLATHDTLQLEPQGYLLDVSDFLARLEAVASHPHRDPTRCDVCAGDLAAAVELYRGDFLQGVSLAGSETLQEWALFKQEELHRRAMEALRRLVEYHAAAGAFEQAIRYAERQIELEPWREEAHRELMRLLALTGRRTAALRQYEACRSLLAAELGVEPAAETTELYERLCNGGGLEAEPAPAPVPGLRSSPGGARPDPGVGPASRPSFEAFVGRGREMAELDRHLRAALAGRGGAVFVTGEAGSGKSALVAEFTRQAEESWRELVVAGARCSAYTGPADSYRPFLEIFRRLVGDLEDLGLKGAIRRHQAARLRALSPVVGEALLRLGPELLDSLLPRAVVARRAESLAPAGSPQRTRMEELLRRRLVRGEVPAVRPADLHAQATAVLRAISRRSPLILVLDDLHWADAGSLSLLSHLALESAGSRVLVVGVYRPEEVAAGRDGARHPLEPVVNELARDLGEVLVDLDRAEGRQFVVDLLASEPNRLGEGFREWLHLRTGGHALFTVELLRGLAERGDLARDEEGRWVEGPQLDWGRIPARVEAVVAERVGRLPKELRRLLSVASVEGEEFTAEVTALVQGADGREVVRLLSGPLGREQRLVAARSLQRVNEKRLSGYRFRHSLFQQYLYGQLDEVERAELHEAVGAALETLYGERAGSEKAVELARHFEAAGLAVRAADYQLQAGNDALRLCDWQEARGRFERGLSLIAGLPDSPERDRREVDLQLALGSALMATDGFGSRSQIAAYSRAHDLSSKLAARVQLWPALHALANSSTARAQYPRALELGEQLLELARRSGESWLLALAHFTLGSTLFSSGLSLVRSREHLEQALLFYEREPDPERRRFLTSLNTFDVGVNSRAWLATVLWILGYPDQALKRSQEALASAQQLEHFLSLVLALYAASHTHHHRGDDRALGESVQQLQRLVAGKHLLIGDVWVEVFGGWLMVREGRAKEGLVRIREGTAAWQKTGAVFGATAQLIALAEASLRAGQAEEGLSAVDEGLRLVERMGARPNEAELHGLKGLLLLSCQPSALSHQHSAPSTQRSAADGQQPGAWSSGLGERLETADCEREAEACFGQAIEVARKQEARSYELRAATSLARLRVSQGRKQEARELLAPIYDWFTEGFDTADLVEAGQLLAEL